MSTGSKFNWRNRVLLLCVVASCAGGLKAVDTTPHSSSSTTTHTKKPKKAQQPQLPPLPSGPTGRPVPQVPLDSIKPIAPQVSFQNGQLTIDAPNSTLGDILRAVKKQTGAEIEIPDSQDRVVMHLGPGPARVIVADLLNGSKFNYVLLGSPEDANALTRIVLVAKSGADNSGPNSPVANNNNPSPDNPGQLRPRRAPAPQPEPEANDDPNDDNNAADDSNNNNEQPQAQPAEAAEQPANQGDQPNVKTPQQMLQEMQQRQMQFQQQQQNGGQPGPGQAQTPQQN
jgi:hypothetical protein